MSDDEIEVVDLSAEEDGNVRGSVPLHMLQGNMDVLLKAYENDEFIPCNGIALKFHDRGVVLVVTADPEQKEIQRQMGFRSVPTSREQ